MNDKGFKEEHIGSDFDDFLREEGILEHCEAVAAKRALARQINELMEKENLNKSSLAKKMRTSRIAVDRLLDPENVSITLQSMEKAAVAFGKKLTVMFT